MREFFFPPLYGGIREDMTDICFDSFLFLGLLAGYSFFDSGDVALLGRKKTSPFSGIGK